MQNPVTLRIVRVQSRPVYMTVCTLSLPRLAKQTAGRAALQVHLSLPFCILCMQHHKHCSVCTHTYLNKHCQSAAPHMFRFQLTCVNAAYTCQLCMQRFSSNVCPCVSCERILCVMPDSCYIFLCQAHIFMACPDAKA